MATCNFWLCNAWWTFFLPWETTKIQSGYVMYLEKCVGSIIGKTAKRLKCTIWCPEVCSCRKWINQHINECGGSDELRRQSKPTDERLAEVVRVRGRRG